MSDKKDKEYIFTQMETKNTFYKVSSWYNYKKKQIVTISKEEKPKDTKGIKCFYTFKDAKEYLVNLNQERLDKELNKAKVIQERIKMLKGLQECI